MTIWPGDHQHDPLDRPGEDDPHPDTPNTLRESVRATYDRRETGDRFTVETRLNGRRIDTRAIPDPFIHTTVYLGWRDRLRGLFGRCIVVTVIVGGDREIVEDVMELDDDYTGRSDSTRRRDWKAQMQSALENHDA